MLTALLSLAPASLSERAKLGGRLAVPRGLAEHLKLDCNLVLDILPKTVVIAPAMSGKFSMIKSESYSPQFTLRRCGSFRGRRLSGQQRI